VFPELAELVVHENALKHALARLGGMKLVFSNAPRHYVAGVLRAIGLARYFDAVYSIEDARYRGKPALHGFRMLLRKHNLDPHRCAFVDDVLENLRTAHRLGMSTVWVSKAKRRVPYVELRVSSVLELPRLVFRYG
jgi:putative hydrolase of the HAD superfamily